MVLEKVRIYCNEDEESIKVKENLIKELEKRDIAISNTKKEKISLAIAIGGDGAFLDMVRKERFNSDVYYVGINTGTLGFLQNVSKDKVSLFVENLANENFIVDDIPLEKATIYCKERQLYRYSINEVVIREKNNKTVRANVEINGSFLESFSGDGLLISTTIGSTAHNYSYCGAIVDRSIETLQITPMAPLKNAKYDNLCNSVITSGNSKIQIKSLSRGEFSLSFDGNRLKAEGIKKVSIELCGKIHTLVFGEKNYVKTINQKLLRNFPE